jgi:hypothetical protein
VIQFSFASRRNHNFIHEWLAYWNVDR